MNFTDKIFGGGARPSGRLSKIETGMLSMQDEIKRLVDNMGKIADMRGVLDRRVGRAGYPGTSSRRRLGQAE